MALALIWSPRALSDIEGIAAYINRDSTLYAESTVSKIFESAQPLVDYPKMGRVVPETGIETIRELFIFQYRLVYEIIDKEVHILAIIHGKRILKADEI
jgi:addiction module RelE/StbE family toxin